MSAPTLYNIGTVSVGRKILAAGLCMFAGLGLFVLANGSLVLNGTHSLPHNGYLMLRWPILPLRGSYVAFTAPKAVAADFRGFDFVKRVEGIPGDEVTVSITGTGSKVCVRDACRMLLSDLLDKGIGPTPAGRLGPDEYLVFGDAPNSLDSRYAVIGPIHRADIHAVGLPVPIPNWKEIHSWFSE